MNRSFLIILAPVLLVGVGYGMVFRAAGVAPGYSRLLAAAAVLVGLVAWVSRKAKRGGAND